MMSKKNKKAAGSEHTPAEAAATEAPSTEQEKEDGPSQLILQPDAPVPHAGTVASLMADHAQEGSEQGLQASDSLDDQPLPAQESDATRPETQVNTSASQGKTTDDPALTQPTASMEELRKQLELREQRDSEQRKQLQAFALQLDLAEAEFEVAKLEIDNQQVIPSACKTHPGTPPTSSPLDHLLPRPQDPQHGHQHQHHQHQHELDSPIRPGGLPLRATTSHTGHMGGLGGQRQQQQQDGRPTPRMGSAPGGLHSSSQQPRTAATTMTPRSTVSPRPTPRSREGPRLNLQDFEEGRRLLEEQKRRSDRLNESYEEDRRQRTTCTPRLHPNTTSPQLSARDPRGPYASRAPRATAPEAVPALSLRSSLTLSLPMPPCHMGQMPTTHMGHVPRMPPVLQRPPSLAPTVQPQLPFAGPMQLPAGSQVSAGTSPAARTQLSAASAAQPAPSSPASVAQLPGTSPTAPPQPERSSPAAPAPLTTLPAQAALCAPPPKLNLRSLRGPELTFQAAPPATRLAGSGAAGAGSGGGSGSSPGAAGISLGGQQQPKYLSSSTGGSAGAAGVSPDSQPAVPAVHLSSSLGGSAGAAGVSHSPGRDEVPTPSAHRGAVVWGMRTAGKGGVTTQAPKPEAKETLVPPLRIPQLPLAGMAAAPKAADVEPAADLAAKPPVLPMLPLGKAAEQPLSDGGSHGVVASEPVMPSLRLAEGTERTSSSGSDSVVSTKPFVPPLLLRKADGGSAEPSMRAAPFMPPLRLGKATERTSDGGSADVAAKSPSVPALRLSKTSTREPDASSTSVASTKPFMPALRLGKATERVSDGGTDDVTGAQSRRDRRDQQLPQ